MLKDKIASNQGPTYHYIMPFLTLALAWSVEGWMETSLLMLSGAWIALIGMWHAGWRKVY